MLGLIDLLFVDRHESLYGQYVLSNYKCLVRIASEVKNKNDLDAHKLT